MAYNTYTLQFVNQDRVITHPWKKTSKTKMSHMPFNKRNRRLLILPPPLYCIYRLQLQLVNFSQKSHQGFTDHKQNRYTHIAYKGNIFVRENVAYPIEIMTLQNNKKDHLGGLRMFSGNTTFFCVCAELLWPQNQFRVTETGMQNSIPVIN